MCVRLGRSLFGSGTGSQIFDTASNHFASRYLGAGRSFGPAGLSCLGSAQQAQGRNGNGGFAIWPLADALHITTGTEVEGDFLSVRLKGFFCFFYA